MKKLLFIFLLVFLVSCNKVEFKQLQRSYYIYNFIELQNDLDYKLIYFCSKYETFEHFYDIKETIKNEIGADNYYKDMQTRMGVVSATKDTGTCQFQNKTFYYLANKYNKGAILRSIINVSNEVRNKHNQIHPTEKPVKLMELLIELVDNNTNDFTVLDPFAGSSATGVACYNLNKNFIGCEIDNEYFNAAVNRIYKECPQNLF